MVWKADEDYSGQELNKIWPLLVPYTRGRVLDVGAGGGRAFAHWMTLDNSKDYGGHRVADMKEDGAGPLPFKDGELDAVVSSHFIEHIEDWETALAEWWRLVKIGGHLVLYWPDPRAYPPVGTKGANPDHKVDIYGDQMVDTMRGLGGWDLLEEQARHGTNEYSCFQVYRKRADAQQNIMPFRRRGNSVLLVRYGAFGDQIVASSVLPLLKQQGWYVVYNTSPKGKDIVADDPHIDEFLIQDENQVRNEDLSEFHAFLGRERYGRVINLCESVEASLLALPGRSNDSWEHAVRHKLMNVNYLERTHDIANVPWIFSPRFYPNEGEIASLKKQIATWPRPIILWVLAGSTAHKLWPYLPQAITRVLYKHPTATIVFAGEERFRSIADLISGQTRQYFGDAKDRLIDTVGHWPIRGTMTLAKYADLVVGPETGVLNAVCMEDVPKVILLSHSSEENLTKHWVNTTAILPKQTPCYPCHRLHLDMTRCVPDRETGTALCQANTSIDDVVNAIIKALVTPNRDWAHAIRDDDWTHTLASDDGRPLEDNKIEWLTLAPDGASPPLKDAPNGNDVHDTDGDQLRFPHLVDERHAVGRIDGARRSPAVHLQAPSGPRDAGGSHGHGDIGHQLDSAPE